ncbi:MAG TPA: hypothetical protein VNN25_10765 [Thermoanaerobaculia bacterium]|nr:hypothetical protein [Thermoanaerobaculia bacterium]
MGEDPNLFDVDAGHFARQFQDQVVPLAKQLIEFANDVVFTGQNLLSASSVQGLQVYRLAQHVVKQPDGADLQPFVDTMSHIVKKTMNRRMKPAPAPQATPSTTTTSHTPPGAFRDSWRRTSSSTKAPARPMSRKMSRTVSNRH